MRQLLEIQGKIRLLASKPSPASRRGLYWQIGKGLQAPKLRFLLRVERLAQIRLEQANLLVHTLA